MSNVVGLKFLRNLSLAAFLGVTPAQAQEIDAETKVHGSKATLQLLGPFLPTLRKLAGADILVVSPDDLTTAEERKRIITKGRFGYEQVTGLTDDEKARRYEALLKKYSAVIPDSYFKTPDARAEFYTLKFDAIVLGSAGALAVQNEKTGKRFCFVRLPLRGASIEKYLADASSLPRRLVPEIKSQSHPRIVFQRAVSHEGSHCQKVSGYDHIADPVDRAIADLADEITADEVSEDTVKAGNPDIKAAVTRTLMEDRWARSIFHIRGGGTPLDQTSSSIYIEYGAPLYDEKGIRFSHADMIYAAQFITLNDRKFLSTLKADDMKRYGLETKSNTFGSDGPHQMPFNIKGAILQLDYPELQYAHLKFIEKQIAKGDLTPDQIKKAGAIVPMIKAYTEGFEGLMPGVVKKPEIIQLMADLEKGTLKSPFIAALAEQAKAYGKISSYEILKLQAATRKLQIP